MRRRKSLFESYRIQQAMLGFTADEYALARSASYSYLTLLETIAMIRRHRR